MTTFHIIKAVAPRASDEAGNHLFRNIRAATAECNVAALAHMGHNYKMLVKSGTMEADTAVDVLNYLAADQRGTIAIAKTPAGLRAYMAVYAGRGLGLTMRELDAPIVTKKLARLARVN